MVNNYEKLGAGQLNSPKNESFSRNITNFTIDDYLFERDQSIVINDTFLNRFVKTSEDVEKEFDFDALIRDRKEQEKIKMMQEI